MHDLDQWAAWHSLGRRRQPAGVIEAEAGALRRNERR